MKKLTEYIETSNLDEDLVNFYLNIGRSIYENYELYDDIIVEGKFTDKISSLFSKITPKSLKNAKLDDDTKKDLVDAMNKATKAVDKDAKPISPDDFFKSNSNDLPDSWQSNKLSSEEKKKRDEEFAKVFGKKDLSKNEKKDIFDVFDKPKKDDTKKDPFDVFAPTKRAPKLSDEAQKAKKELSKELSKKGVNDKMKNDVFNVFDKVAPSIEKNKELKQEIEKNTTYDVDDYDVLITKILTNMQNSKNTKAVSNLSKLDMFNKEGKSSNHIFLFLIGITELMNDGLSYQDLESFLATASKTVARNKEK